MIRVLFGGPLQTFRSRLLTILTLYVQYKYMARSDESRFDWDRHNIGHIAKHRVKPEEVEQVLSNNPVFIEMETDVLAERRESPNLAIQTRVGFSLLYGPGGADGRALVTAFDADAQTRALYTEAQFRRDDE